MRPMLSLSTGPSPFGSRIGDWARIEIVVMFLEQFQRGQIRVEIGFRIGLDMLNNMVSWSHNDRLVVWGC